MDLTRPDRGAAFARLTATVESLGTEESRIYLMLCMGMLAKNAPDVVLFVMDRVDGLLEGSE